MTLQDRTCTMVIGLSVALSPLATTSRALAQVGPGTGPEGMTGPMLGGIPGMGGGQGSPAMILLAPSVQKELKLSDEQKGKAYKLAQMANQKGPS